MRILGLDDIVCTTLDFCCVLDQKNLRIFFFRFFSHYLVQSRRNVLQSDYFAIYEGLTWWKFGFNYCYNFTYYLYNSTMQEVIQCYYHMESVASYPICNQYYLQLSQLEHA
jgi:hypothetical protein